ncbi:MAG: phage virion morphogenesis protein [Rhodospirillales bacterium]|nr:phage virion morphogenesis protein [Rhodospirillales bacterium]
MRVSVELDDRAIVDAMNRALGAARDLSPVMRDIGESLLNSTGERFGTQTAPDGSDWAKLSPTYKARKRRNRDKIGTLRGHLRATLAYDAGPDSVVIGSPRIYAGTFHFGAAKGAYGTSRRGLSIPWGDIPARPVFGISDADRTDIVEALHDHIVASIRRK